VRPSNHLTNGEPSRPLARQGGFGRLLQSRYLTCSAKGAVALKCLQVRHLDDAEMVARAPHTEELEAPKVVP